MPAAVHGARMPHRQHRLTDKPTFSVERGIALNTEARTPVELTTRVRALSRPINTASITASCAATARAAKVGNYFAPAAAAAPALATAWSFSTDEPETPM